MGDKEIEKLTTGFRSISNYNDALTFWDRHGLDFRDDKKITDEGIVFISIVPKNAIERRSYNRWIIDHWRSYYINREYSAGQVTETIDLIFKNFETLKEDYNNRVALKGKKLEVIADEIKYTDAKLALLANNPQNERLIAAIYKRFKSNREADFYEYEPSTVNRFNKLRLVAKAWDLIQYKVFLIDQRLLSQTGIINELDFLVWKQLNTTQLHRLHSFLIDGKYLKGEYSLFEKAFTVGLKEGDQKLFWIDPQSKKNGETNRQTLLQLVYGLLGDITADSGLLFKFIRRSFSTKYFPIGKSELTTAGIKQSLSLFKKKLAKTEKVDNKAENKQEKLKAFMKTLIQ